MPVAPALIRFKHFRGTPAQGRPVIYDSTSKTFYSWSITAFRQQSDGIIMKLVEAPVVFHLKDPEKTEMYREEVLNKSLPVTPNILNTLSYRTCLEKVQDVLM